MEELEEALEQQATGKGLESVISKVLQLSFFVGLAVLAPYFGNQLLTGTIVNALLFIAVVLVGLEYAFFLCLIPSLISLYTGFLSMVMAPIVPFIIISNGLLIFVFAKLKNRGFWFAAIPAAFIKFIFIFSAAFLLANSFLQGMAKNLIFMFSWPQLATALAGAAISYILLKVTKKI